MDQLLPDLIGVVPELGAAGVLVVVLWIALRAQGQDRTDYRTALAGAADRHNAEVKRINTDHDAELAELRGEIKELRTQVDELERRLDVERKLRREAEDMAARTQRRPGGQR